MSLKDILKIKKDLKELIINKNILDIIVFGSFVKGKLNPNDIDIALIVENSKININYKEKYHFSILSIKDIFTKHHSLVNTLLREGYSIKYGKSFSELFKFSNKILFFYELNNLSASQKVKLVNNLHGKKHDGLVELNNGN